MQELSFQLLGNTGIAHNGVSITRFRSEKARALLFFLILEDGRAHTREHLCGMFWGEQAETNARHNLSQAIFYLQNALGKETVERVLDISRASLEFRRDAETYVDAHEFLGLLRATETHVHKQIESCEICIPQLERASTLYRGELLAQFFVDDCPTFEEWLVVQRENFQRRALAALGHLAAFYEARGNDGYVNAVRYARRQVELEPWHEEPYRVMMRALAAMNQRETALAQYHALTNVLRQELGLEPSAETNALYKHLRGASGTTDNRLQTAENTVEPTPTNLPLPAAPLVGRATELEQLSGKLAQSDCRLLTLIGQGGIGKTRLAIQTALNHRWMYPRGAYFVDLAETYAPELIPHAVAGALQFTFRGAAAPAQQLIEHLQGAPQALLLVMDNFEQVVSGATFVSEMLKRVPNVTLMVTSREPLNVDGEWLFEVEGLAAPTGMPAQLDRDWDAPDAVRLLVQCATRANVNLQKWSVEDKRAAIRITQLVEGMPLAIELASAWLRTLTPREIADEIARGLDVFNSTRRDLPARHASIRAVFEHSWALLTDTERDVFARLSVFHGGTTREAAREVAGASLQTLSALVDKSLVKRAAAGRYRLHELVRQFAAEKLKAREGGAGSGERGASVSDGETEARHSAYYLKLVLERAPLFNAAGAHEVLEELRHDLDNLRRAWRAACVRHDTALLASSLNGFAEFFVSTSLYQEGLVELEVATAQLVLSDAHAAREIVSRLAAQQARMLGQLARHEEAIVKAQEAIALGEQAGAAQSVAEGYLYWGYTVRRQGDYVRARGILEKAIQLAHAAQLPNLESQAGTYLGGTYWNESAYGPAREYWERAVALCRTQNNLRGESFLLNNLAMLSQEGGDFPTAREYLTQALQFSKMVGTDQLWGAVLVNLGLVEIDQCAFDAAAKHLDEGLHFFREIQGAWQEHLTLLGLGQLALRTGDYARASTQLEVAVQGLGALHAQTDHARALGLLGLVEHYMGHAEQASARVMEGIAVAREIGDRFTLGKNLLILGHVRSDEKDLDAAQAAYAEALTVLEQLGLRHLEAEARAGLAYVALARGERREMREQSKWLKSYLSEQTLDGADEPMRVWLTSWQVLRALKDAEADEFLVKGHAQLTRDAAGIGADETRTRFLENVAVHREFETVWTRRNHAE